MHSSRILFVEDDVLCAIETCEALREHGYGVVEVHRAKDAFRVIADHGRLTGLVTDVDLGPGADGFEIARRARAAHPGLPVVFISGSAAARHSAEGVIGSQFIAKPFHPRQVLEALDGGTRLAAA